MPRTISANDVNGRLSEVFDWVREHGDEVIVEREGAPGVVIIPYPEYEELQRLREQEDRRDALERLRSLRERVLERNQDLSDEEAEALADRYVRDVIADMAAEGLIKFARDS